MKTLTAPIQQKREFQIAGTERFAPSVSVSFREVLALLSAVTAATAIILLSVWASGLEMTAVLGASTWGISFVFLGLAVDNREPTAIFQLSTGLALMVLAWLQNTVSPNFIIISGLLIATWASVELFRRLR